MESPYVTISGSWESYLSRRDKKVRRNFDYFEKKIHREGKVELVKIEGGADLSSHIADALEIEKSSWKGEEATAIVNSDDERDFYMDLAHRMSAQGRFALYFLLFNGEKIAFDYCLKYRDQFYVLKTGYNPAHAKNSPGRVLRLKILRNLHQEGIYKHYDLLGSFEKWKTEWTDSAERLCRVTVFNKKPGSIFLCNLMNASETFKKSIKRFPIAYDSLKQIRDGLLTRAR
jgi:CelD/BcsL family acetyltransferase involved in cellulose biosynthesis